MIEKNERAHHVVVRMGQHAADLEVSEAAPALIDQHNAHERRASTRVGPAFRRTALKDVR